MDKALLLASAISILKQFGARCKIEHIDGATTYASGVITRPSSSLIANTSIVQGSLVCWMQGGLKRSPEAGDIVKFGSKAYMVDSVTRIDPDGSLTYAYAVSIRT
jgi:transcription elongation factor